MILSNQLQLPGPAELWEPAALMVPETQAAVAVLPSQLEALAADPERLLAMQQAGQKLWHRYGLPGFAGDVVDFLRDPLAVAVHVSSPAELPLHLRRSLRHKPQQRSVLIQINDNGPRELLRLRWQAALRLCEQQLVGRSAAVVSVVPELEEVFGRDARQSR